VNKEIKNLAESIMATHGGQASFNFKEVSKILGCGVNTVPLLLNDSGILVKRIGSSKRISAYDVATLILIDRIAPVDNTSRYRLLTGTST